MEEEAELLVEEAELLVEEAELLVEVQHVLQLIPKMPISAGSMRHTWCKGPAVSSPVPLHRSYSGPREEVLNTQRRARAPWFPDRTVRLEEADRQG
ncbi:hypothetical protein P4O66_004529 [Electrophorus voltai]|uniref:Uncharacterized protein n=1 Tax=Electrophorus voltai TaxID=2609070 RepID=A0AAD8ZLI3_9TELE|nr:hypothetical protein P4O66_004529 [Electrophorus voltai]